MVPRRRELNPVSRSRLGTYGPFLMPSNFSHATSTAARPPSGNSWGRPYSSIARGRTVSLYDGAGSTYEGAGSTGWKIWSRAGTFLQSKTTVTRCFAGASFQSKRPLLGGNARTAVPGTRTPATGTRNLPTYSGQPCDVVAQDGTHAKAAIRSNNACDERFVLVCQRP